MHCRFDGIFNYSQHPALYLAMPWFILFILNSGDVTVKKIIPFPAYLDFPPISYLEPPHILRFPVRSWWGHRQVFSF